MAMPNDTEMAAANDMCGALFSAPANTTPTAMPSGRLCMVTARASIAVFDRCERMPSGLSVPICRCGVSSSISSRKLFVLGSLSGVVEPIGAIAVLLLASLIMPALPYMLAFAAGAMFYVVVEELIPEASSGQHSNLSTIGFAIGFVLMMVLDVVMG